MQDHDRPGRAVVLLSGGLDSSTVLAIVRARGYEPWALTVRYGQRHTEELEAARRVAQSIGVAGHEEIDVGLGRFGGSALTAADIPVPKDREPGEGGVPPTYVPGRNTVLLALALAWAEVLGAEDLFIGVNSIDYSGYPDCRPEFIEAFERAGRLGTVAGGARIHAPLIELTKGEIIRWGTDLGVDYALTSSCYDPVAGAACGRCDACILRRRGFQSAGVVDPTTYAG
ncbi:MAG: 7-cyano-7-deazaguanine synthase QueC [Gemmatimonadota bacterium]|nr:7-cyano-7-deazaguanine synthase QueC [Gemmatimonadota bacterium]